MPAAEPVGPVRDDELSALFAPAAGAVRIALAVSGGADSLALLCLYDRWRRRAKGPDAVVLTVDHRLRRESRREAADVADAADMRGLPVRILVWKGEHPRTGLEAAARTARYRLLLGACAEAGASHLLLAHHRDDQAETLLLRLARGSGIFGLAAMRPMVKAGAVTILRPFLDVPRARLAATVAIAGLAPVADPMNADPRFARARIRRIMPLLAADGIDPAGLAESARRFAAAADAIDAAASDLIGAAVEVDDLAVAKLDADLFRLAPGEVRLRLLARLLMAVGGDDYAPHQVKLAAMAAAIAGFPRRGRFKRTLAGTVVDWRQGRFHFYREIGRSGLARIKVMPGFDGIWDHRFAVQLDGKGGAGLTLGALGEAGRLEIGARAGEAAAGALAALPVLRRGETLISVPLPGFPAGKLALQATFRQVVGSRLAEPPRFPDLAVD
ncbi:MAG: tRNA lysidine(34) synthetase TilS [Bauldia sp.]